MRKVLGAKKGLEKKLIITTSDITTVTIKKYTLDREQIIQKLFVETPLELALSARVIYQYAKNNKIKVTQKGELTVRSAKLLDANLTVGYNYYIWLLNFLINNKYLGTKQEKLPTKAFDKLINSDDGVFTSTIFTKFLNLKMQKEFDFIPFDISKYSGNGIKEFRTSIIEIIKTLKNNEWINIDYIANQIAITPRTLKQITNNNHRCYNFKNSSRTYYESYNRIENLKIIVRFFIKSFVGTMNRFGLCSIAKTAQESFCGEDFPDLQIRYDIEYTAVEYFKLSSIGLFSLGIEDIYVDKNDFTLVLNDYNYEIGVNTPNGRSDILLSNIAKKISSTKYYTNLNIFMGNVDSEDSYNSIKKLFLSKCTNMPPNWKRLIETMDSRISSATIVSSTSVLIKINNSKEILHIISSNPNLKDKMLKADKFHLVVLKENLAYVKKIFKENGVIL